MKALRLKVKEVYKACGFEADANPDTLSMLTDLEVRCCAQALIRVSTRVSPTVVAALPCVTQALLEDLLSEIASMSPAYVIQKEKEKQKQRRDELRLERLAQQQLIYEQRLKKSMERSQAPAKKKLGKQVMFRSPPLKKRVREKKRDTKADQEAADLIYLT